MLLIEQEMLRQRTDLTCPDCQSRAIEQEGPDLQCVECGFVWEDEEYPSGEEEE